MCNNVLGQVVDPLGVQELTHIIHKGGLETCATMYLVRLWIRWASRN